MDEETLKTDPDALGGSSLTDFRALYSSMRAEDTTDVQRHMQTVQEEWKSRGISFRENERIRLITVFFHDKSTEEESILFVGHAGVLLTADDGTLYFVEKVAFQEPYRLLRFADRTELSDYLMGKYDVSWGQSTARPFIMENDELDGRLASKSGGADVAHRKRISCAPLVHRQRSRHMPGALLAFKKERTGCEVPQSGIKIENAGKMPFPFL